MAKYENTNPLEKLHEGEPYFFLRAQDIRAPYAVHEYAKAVAVMDPKAGEELHEFALRMELWQDENPDKVKQPEATPARLPSTMGISNTTSSTPSAMPCEFEAGGNERPATNRTWITNIPKTSKSLWPRRAGVVYHDGEPRATAAFSAAALKARKIVGVYVDITREEYNMLPRINKPEK